MPFLRKYTGPLKTAARKRLSAIAIAVDAYFNYVTLLLSGDGTNAAQNNTFLDSSTNNFTITRNGNTTQGSFSPYGDNWSNFFNGTDATLDFSNSSNFAFGTGSFTIEFWINGPLNNDKFILGGRSAIGTMHITTGGSASTAGVLRYVGTSAIVSSNVITDNTWHHCAIVRNGSSNITLYVDGVSVGTGTDTTNYTTTSGTWYIARNDLGASNFLSGYLSNLRIVKGTAVYTSAFTPSTTPLTAISGTSLLTCQSNRFVDNSATPVTITSTATSVQRFNPFGASTAYSTSVIGGSGYFDGTGDYLTAPDNTAFEFGSGDFTIEAWAYPLDGGFQMLVAKSPDNSATGWQFFASGDELNFYASTGGSWNVGFYSSGAPIKRNAWNHLAVTRSGSTWTIWVNGVSQATATSSITINNNSLPVAIGAFTNASYFSYGYTADVRIIKGTALYTSNFTPPTAPLTAITNTSLLTSFTNGAIFDNAMMNNLENVADARISTSVVKYGTGSISFDGGSDTLKITPDVNVNMNFGTGPFTFECWIYRSSASGQIFIADFGVSSANGWALYDEGSGGNMQFRIADVDRIAVSPIPATTWTHLAIVRVGTTVTLYVNGTSAGSYSSASTNLIYAGTKYIGSQSGSSSFMNGYIDDLRITKGFARYTANFTPPTAALGTISAS